MSMFIPIAKGYNSIRGSFKLGVVDLGTQSSLITRKSGKHLMLDALTMEAPVKVQVDKITDGGKSVEAIINLHPFHTMHCEWAHKAFPDAKLYGSERHLQKFPNLPWERELVDSPEMAELFKDDVAFSKPEGVDFISSNEAVHFSSILAFHWDSKTMHVDDTFIYVPTPKVAEYVGIKEGVITLHPTLPGALQHRAGATDDFRDWVHNLTKSWDVENMTAAHSGNLTKSDNTGKTLCERMTDALWLAEPVLKAHETIYGKRASKM